MQRRLAAILAADVVGYGRLMHADEAGTLADLKRHWSERVKPRLQAHRGRVVKLMGDGVLVEFASVVDAVECAVAIQRDMAAVTDDVPAERRIVYRVGINVGEVIVEDDDVYGDGVNLAARLEGLAEPGGICLSAEAARYVRGKVDVPLVDRGSRQVKNVDEPVHVFTVALDEVGAGDAPHPGLHQDIRYCRAHDGVQIAYASVGEGPPLVKAANWMNHLEYDWESPIMRHWFTELAKTHRVVRYDERGNGLSDWQVDDLSFESFVADLETVVDAAGLERFPLLGISQGCAVSIAYAVRHPERVSALVLYGGYAAGWRARGETEEVERREAMLQLTRFGWGQDNPAFRQVFTSLFVPGGTAEQMAWFNELQRMSTSPENAARIQDVLSRLDVRQLLPEVRAPTLVLHNRGDSVAPFECGREFAKTIPGARFVPLDSPNHILLQHEPAWPKFLAEVRSFLAEHAGEAAAPAS